MLFRRLLPLALIALAAASGAQAQITVNRSVIELGAGSPVQDIEILNTGDAKAYLDLSIAEIVDPEAPEPTRVELDDPRTAPVLVSPRQLLVPPGTRKRVRVILRQASEDVDRVYRLRIQPYTGKARLAGADPGKKASAIRVLIGYDLLLLARPDNATPGLKVARDGDSIEFRNEGNTNVLLRRIVQCEAGVDPDADDADEACAEIPPNRLYAGETYRVALPKKGPAKRFPVKVWQSVGLESASGLF